MPSIFRALAYRNYRLFFVGQGISLVGTWTTRLATSWLVYRLTRSTLLLGIIGFTSQLPTFLLAPIGGVLADRYDRRFVLTLTQVLLALQTITMAVLTLTRRITVLEVILLSTLQATINGFEIPTRNSLLVDLVDGRAHWGNAIALTYAMESVARLLGAALAGITIAAIGEGYCFLVDGGSYFAVIISLLIMSIKKSAPTKERATFFTELREGWRYVAGFGAVRTILLLFAVVCFVGVPYTVLMPLFASQLPGGGPHEYGFLMASVGMGALISGVRLARRKSAEGFENIIGVSAAFLGLGLMFFSMSRILWLSLLLSAAIGFGMTQQFTASSTVIQAIVPATKRARVMSYWTMAYMGAVPSGSLLVGALASAVGGSRTLILCGAGCLIAAIWFSVQRHEVRDQLRHVM